MADIWVISDTHFSHANILNFKDSRSGLKVRPFTSVEEMDEHMIENWNEVVKPQDKIYHLGDVYFGAQNRADEILSRLNGKKRLVIGNHDVVYGRGNILQKHFQKIHLWRMFREDKLLLTHVPVHASTLGEHRFNGASMTNIHGHIHQNKSPEGPYRCVCVEQTGYKPINLDQLRNT